MGEYSDTDWWTAAADHFDDLLWLYYPDRTVFLNKRFPYDPSDPDNATNIAQVIANITKTFAIYLKSNNYKYSKLYGTIIAEYNPLYNVDAWEQTERNLTQTGTVDISKSGYDKNAKSGDDTLDYMGTEDVTRSGNETLAKEGTEARTRTGNETLDYEGSEALTKSGSEDLSHTGSKETTTQKTTYDSATFYDTEKVTETPPTDTTTYNSVADTKTFTDRTDTKTYNSVEDKTSFDDRVDTKTYNDVKDSKSFTGRKDKQNYNSTNTMTYNSGSGEDRNLEDNEVTKVRRYGNIGVTASQDLLEKERNVALFDFYKTVVHDCVNLISYAVS